MTRGPLENPYGTILRTSLVVLLFLSFLLAQADGTEGSVSQGVYTGNEIKHHVDLHFDGEGRDQSLSLRLPGGGEIIRPSLHIGSIPGSEGPTSVFVDIGLDNRFEWEFGGGNEGNFGEQISFTDGGSFMTKVADGSEETFSFYLPSGALIKEATINVSSPPSPEADGSKKLLYSYQSDFDLDAIDTADINGDGNLELIYHDNSTERIYVSGITSQGKTFRKVILSDVVPPVHLRAAGKDQGRPSIIVVSKPSQNNGQEVWAFVGDEPSNMNRTLLSKGLENGSSGFALAPGGASGLGLMVLNGSSGGVMKYQFEENGELERTLLLDRSINASSVSLSDLDGDGDQDMLLFPSGSSMENITLLESTGTELVSIDTGLRYRSNGIGASADIDGDGREEMVIGIGSGSDPALLRLTGEKGLTLNWIGMNYTRCSPRIINGGYRRIGGHMKEIEDVLYLSTFNGLYHLTQGSDANEDIIWRRSRSFDAVPIAPCTVDPGSMISLRRDLAFVQHSIKWSTASGIGLQGPGGEELKVDVPFRANRRTDLSALITGETDLPVWTNSFRTYFERYDITFHGSDGLVRLDGLSVSYDIDLEISGSPNMEGALDNVMEQLTGDWIPFSVGVADAGNVRVGPARVEYDEPPVIEPTLPRIILAPEDSRATTHFNIRDHITDDYLLPQGLDVQLVMLGSGPEDLVFTDRSGNVVTKAFEYPDHFGEHQFFFRVSDLRSTTISEPVTLMITPQQDRPMVVGDPGPLELDEGETLRIPLQGVNGIFHDPDGDRLEFDLEVLEQLPVDMLQRCSLEIEGSELVVRPSTLGSGGEMTIMVHAKDPYSSWEQSTRTMVYIRVEDVDSPPIRGENPGRIHLVEDQSTPSRIPLEGWLTDPDTGYEEYEIVFHTSSPYIDVFSSSYKGEEYLFITPMNDLVGEHYILIEMTDGQRSVMDRLDLFIEPVNDVPIIEFNGKELLEGRGWLVTGSVKDPDSQQGTVEYRIGDGPWRTAWGFKSWSMVIDFKDTDNDPAFVFFRASDGQVSSPAEYIKLERPEVVPDPIVPEDPDQDDGDDNAIIDDDRDDDSDLDGVDLVPPPSDEGPPWLVLGGTLGVIVAAVIFFGWTEIGIIIVATVGSSIYSKLSRKDILNHEIRGLIRGYIIANPGDHYSSIKRNLDLNNGTLAYHLRVLEQNGFIKSMYDGIYKRYYPSNVNISKLKKNVSKQEEIFNIILDNPGITMEQIGRMIGVSRQVVNYHVKNLIRAGVVDYMRDKRSAKFYPSDNGSNLMESET